MSAKKKTKNVVDEVSLFEQDETLIALKERYFKLIPQEDYPKTKQLTDTLDKLEAVINLRKMEIITNTGNETTPNEIT